MITEHSTRRARQQLAAHVVRFIAAAAGGYLVFLYAASARLGG